MYEQLDWSKLITTRIKIDHFSGQMNFKLGKMDLI